MIEIRETTKPAERAFSIAFPRDGYFRLVDVTRQVSEAELRELVEKGAEALGIPQPDWTRMYAEYEVARIKGENARLRGWLEAISSANAIGNRTHTMIRQALAGEEAPHD